jgi:hypothetical protein
MLSAEVCIQGNPLGHGHMGNEKITMLGLICDKMEVYQDLNISGKGAARL